MKDFIRNFNPRSRKGSDPFRKFQFMQKILFQSTLPQGERLHSRRQGYCYPSISIHAPARGATDFIRGILSSVNHFNPRSRKGSDNCRIINGKGCKYFNPRSRKGSDPDADVVFCESGTFQSTLPQGERRYPVWIFDEFIPISIHAPARGATLAAV